MTGKKHLTGKNMPNTPFDREKNKWLFGVPGTIPYKRQGIAKVNDPQRRITCKKRSFVRLKGTQGKGTQGRPSNAKAMSIGLAVISERESSAFWVPRTKAVRHAHHAHHASGLLSLGPGSDFTSRFHHFPGDEVLGPT